MLRRAAQTPVTILSLSMFCKNSTNIGSPFSLRTVALARKDGGLKKRLSSTEYDAPQTVIFQNMSHKNAVNIGSLEVKSAVVYFRCRVLIVKQKELAGKSPKFPTATTAAECVMK